MKINNFSFIKTCAKQNLSQEIPAAPTEITMGRDLPTIYHYSGPGGGYVAIYTRDVTKAVYGVGGGIYVMGRVRCKGEYIGGIFIPDGYESGDDITQDPEILAVCERRFPDMKGKMWLGGETPAWRTPHINPNWPPNDF